MKKNPISANINPVGISEDKERFLFLSEDGIFPITKDNRGNLIKNDSAKDVVFSGTIQGEGKLAGIPSLFVRLAQCNLCCSWVLPDGNECRCDTMYASNNLLFKQIKVKDALETIKQNLGTLKHVVITGGEPMLQNESLVLLTNALKLETKTHLTLETNGTLFDKRVARNIDLFSISPKLKNSHSLKPNSNICESSQTEICNKKRKNIEVLQSYINFARNNNKDIQMKFVVANENEEIEIKEEFLWRLKNLSQSDIMVMPLGASVKELEQTSQNAFNIAVKNGWRFSPRLHIYLGCA